jgi:hypothetical protein
VLDMTDRSYVDSTIGGIFIAPADGLKGAIDAKLLEQAIHSAINRTIRDAYLAVGHRVSINRIGDVWGVAPLDWSAVHE